MAKRELMERQPELDREDEILRLDMWGTAPQPTSYSLSWPVVQAEGAITERLVSDGMATLYRAVRPCMTCRRESRRGDRVRKRVTIARAQTRWMRVAQVQSYRTSIWCSRCCEMALDGLRRPWAGLRLNHQAVNALEWIEGNVLGGPGEEYGYQRAMARFDAGVMRPMPEGVMMVRQQFVIHPRGAPARNLDHREFVDLIFEAEPWNPVPWAAGEDDRDRALLAEGDAA